jgi:hypothetical protein
VVAVTGEGEVINIYAARGIRSSTREIPGKLTTANLGIFNRAKTLVKNSNGS